MKNGTIVGSSTSRTVNIIWNDVADVGTLTVTLSNCTEATNTTTSNKYAIRSLAGRIPTNPIAYYPLRHCETTSVMLKVDQMVLNNTGGTTGIPTEFADGYEWSLPTGWKTTGGFSGVVRTSTEFVYVSPDNGCRGGTVTVKAYKDCTSGRKYSSSTSISIERVGLERTISVPSGYTGPKCGKVAPVKFTAQDFPCAVSFRWTSTNTAWKLNGVTNGPWTTSINTLTLTPTGTPADDGIISVDIDLGCGIVTQTYRAVYSDPKQPTPTLITSSPNEALCIGDAKLFTCEPPLGYGTTYGFDWAATGPLLVNNVSASTASPLKTTTNTATVSVPVGAASGFQYV